MKKKKINFPKSYDILFALIGVAFCGIGAGFANCALLGMDSIGIFYDGIRNILGLSSESLGIASYIVNGTIIAFLFIVSRKYVNFGTFVHFVAYGSFITVGNAIFNLIGNDELYVRIIFCVVGYLLLYTGVSLFVAIDIGVDAFTGLVLFLTDLTHFKLKYVKMVFDLILIVVGFVLGGVLGVATVVTMVAAGPFIDVVSKKFQSLYFTVFLKFWRKNEKGRK
ncbi:MAG: hypothetical protein IKP88_17105 [Lachnospiraceae bacterium]|nr:hypothetical protein [Lachnospiraceae bacterium]